MWAYILRRLALIPVTLFFIILVNFIIINLAPGDPVSVTQISPEGGVSRKDDKAVAFGNDSRYLQFREHYGLTLPILFNTWPWIGIEEVRLRLWQLQKRRYTPEDKEEINVKDFDQMRIRFGDQARFIMPELLQVILDPNTDPDTRSLAVRFFVRGGTRQGYIGPNLTEEQKNYNKKVSKSNLELLNFMIGPNDNKETKEKKIADLAAWYAANEKINQLNPNFWQKVRIFFFETRFFRYFSRVLTLDFGTMRNDENKTVISEVTRRFKYSLTLSIIPLLVTLVLCQVFGFLMAYHQRSLVDYSLNFIFLVLYAIPVFVVAPFLIEKIAMNHTFPFTNTPIPISGFTSPDSIYALMTSKERLFDTLRHIFLPLVAILYGALAAESRLSRTAVLEVSRQDYVRTAYAKGVSKFQVMTKHVGRNAAITIVTSIAGSLGVVLGGSLIVETLFEINGFGKFFYDAVINRDYNVIMFSALAGSFLTLLGYLVADIAYTVLDPRVTLD